MEIGVLVLFSTKKNKQVLKKNHRITMRKKHKNTNKFSKNLTRAMKNKLLHPLIEIITCACVRSYLHYATEIFEYADTVQTHPRPQSLLSF